MTKSILFGGALLIASLAGFNGSIGTGVESDLSGRVATAISDESRNRTVTTTTTTETVEETTTTTTTTTSGTIKPAGFGS